MKEGNQAAQFTESARKAARAEKEQPAIRLLRSRLFLVGLIITIGAFGVLTALVKRFPTWDIDVAFSRALQSFTWEPWGWLMHFVSWIGFTPQNAIISGLVIFIIFILGWYWEAVSAGIAGALTMTVNFVAKNLIDRPRPTADLVEVFWHLEDFSFPSGHVMYFVGFFGFVFYLLYSLIKPSRKRTAALVALVLLIALVGFSRIWLGQHWMSDVLGAYLLGMLTLVASIVIYRWGKPRFFTHQPVGGDEDKPESDPIIRGL
ncbi:MAG: phosphatase PAP2 family protein [Chloroflexi bacterium]|nr:phosphatase PAP2 family protein [Chloroflexota bacterium]